MFYNVILVIIELVEKAIGIDMCESGYSSILYNGWTKTATHYVDVFTMHMREIKTINKGAIKKEEIPVITLLTCSPFGNYKDKKFVKNHIIYKYLAFDFNIDTNKNMSEKAIAFNAEIYYQFFISSFKYYNADFEDWIKCQTTDRIKVNIRIRVISSKPTVAYFPCFLYSEINRLQYKILKLEAFLTIFLI